MATKQTKYGAALKAARKLKGVEPIPIERADFLDAATRQVGINLLAHKYSKKQILMMVQNFLTPATLSGLYVELHNLAEAEDMEAASKIRAAIYDAMQVGDEGPNTFHSALAVVGVLRTVLITLVEQGAQDHKQAMKAKFKASRRRK